MIQTSSHRAAHHQTLTIEHLKYENELLLKRNQALAEENRKLIQELDDCLGKLAAPQLQSMKVLQKEKELVLKYARQDCNKLFQRLDQGTQRAIGGLVCSYKEALEQGSFQQLYQHLSEIISKLLVQKSQVRKSSLKQYLNATEQRLMMRKTARERTSQIVHLIKQPPKQFYITSKDQQEDLKIIVDLSKKVARKIKKQTISIHHIDEIFQSINELMKNRWNLKNQESRLLVLQREFQLGKLRPFDQQACVYQISHLSQSSKAIRLSIEQRIDQLTPTS